MTEKQFEEYRNLRQERDTYKELLNSLENDRLSFGIQELNYLTYHHDTKSYPIDNDLKDTLKSHFQAMIEELTHQMEAL